MIKNDNTYEPPIEELQIKNDIGEKCENSRCDSASSQLSSSTTSPNCDSGNISDLNCYFHPTSLSSTEDESFSGDNPQLKYQHLLREKDQSLFLALQDVRKIKSELERISKSEKWYKCELRSQRNLKLELLEKLYTNQRKFTEENQKLQNKCTALCTRCDELENQLKEQNELALKKVKIDPSTNERNVSSTLDFELNQHLQKIADQEQLILMLGNQKRSLLNELESSSSEKEQIVLQLQKSFAQLEEENRTIIKRCLELVESKILLSDQLLARESECKRMENDILDFKLTIKDLQKNLHSQIDQVNKKQQQIDGLKFELSQQVEPDEIKSLLLRKHKHELSEKDQTIASLNETVTCLKEKVSSQEEIQIQLTEKEQEINNLRNHLKEKNLELENFKILNENIIRNPQTDVTSTINLEKELNSSQNSELGNLQKLQNELKEVSEKYVHICKLYEESKFNLDLKEITVQKMKFEKEKDTNEIKSLREKFIQISNKFDYEKSMSTEMEFQLSKMQREKQRIEKENKCNINQIVQLKLESSQSLKKLNEKEKEVDNLKEKLFLELKKNKIQDLTTLQYEKESSERRVELIQKLIAHQAEKVQKLNSEQEEWRNVLSLVDQKEQCEQMSYDSEEFYNLNQLFDDQNLELIELNKNHLKQIEQFKRTIKNTEDESNLFKLELEGTKFKITDLEKQITILEDSNIDYQKEIAQMAQTNENLIQDFNEDFSRERENHKKLLKSEAKVHRIEYDKLREQMQAEIDNIKTSQKILENCDNECHKKENTKDLAAQERILNNVLETEHQRKLNRYDVHIRSLLSSIKSYKKKLEVSEKRYENLIVRSKEMVDVQEVKEMECQLQEMRMQFESSQREINNLKHQLKTVKEEFYAADARKTSTSMDFTNLMDDYKKLIQQSQATTKRLSTAEIYNLINKSNNFVPKLTNISTSVDGLRDDIQKVCTVINMSTTGGMSRSPQPKMSLMDELKFAESVK